MAASAYLYSNGNTLFADENGEQIIELQRLGMSGLHRFVERYPDAPIYWCVWGQATSLITPEEIPWLLRHIRMRPAPRPE